MRDQSLLTLGHLFVTNRETAHNLAKSPGALGTHQLVEPPFWGAHILLSILRYTMTWNFELCSVFFSVFFFVHPLNLSI